MKISLIEDVSTGLAASFLVCCSPEGVKLHIVFNLHGKCTFYTSHCCQKVTWSFSLMTIKVLRFFEMCVRYICIWIYMNMNIHIYMNLIKPWASNTLVWCEHIFSLIRGNLICFPGIHFPTNYFQKHMLFHRARYQNFINIWLNMKSHGINYQSVWTTS